MARLSPGLTVTRSRIAAPYPPRGAILPSALPPPAPPEAPQPVIVSSVTSGGTVKRPEAPKVRVCRTPAGGAASHATTTPPKPGPPFVTTAFLVAVDQ